MPMSKSGHNLALTRWMHSQALVAGHFSRARQDQNVLPAVPPLQRMCPVTFLKSLKRVPPSRVLSPDTKPVGNVQTAISISPAPSRLPDVKSPDKMARFTQRHLHVRNDSKEKVDVLTVADDGAASCPDERGRSTPSPPPLRVLRLGGIVSGEKNVFIAEKSK
jgi:hypothetical protein